MKSRFTSDGRVIVSPSGIKKVKLCHRAAYYNYTEELRGPGSAANNRGTVIHSLIEDYLREGIEPSEVGVAKALGGIGGSWNEDFTIWLPNERVDDSGKYRFTEAHMPMFMWAANALIKARAKNLRDCVSGLEVPLTLDREAARYRGYTDVLSYGDKGYQVDDWKTTTDVKKWSMTEDQLREDEQAIIYAAAVAEQYDQPEVRCTWTYVQFKGKCTVTKVVSAVLDRIFLAEKMIEIDEIALQFKNILSSPGPADSVEPTGLNTGGCFAFGGCSYLDQCPVSAFDKSLSFLRRDEKLTNMKPKTTLYEQLSQDTFGRDDEIAPGNYGGVNRDSGPPDVAPSYLLQCTCETEERFDHKCAVGHHIGEHEPKAWLTVLCTCPDEDCKASHIEELKIVKWDGNKPVIADPTYFDRYEPDLEAPIRPTGEYVLYEKEREKAPDQKPSTGGYVLCLDCGPASGDVPGLSVDGWALIRKAMEIVAKEKGSDYRIGTYGEGKAFLADALRPLVAEIPPSSLVYLWNSRTPEVADVLHVLVDGAGLVIR